MMMEWDLLEDYFADPAYAAREAAKRAAIREAMAARKQQQAAVRDASVARPSDVSHVTTTNTCPRCRGDGHEPGFGHDVAPAAVSPCKLCKGSGEAAAHEPPRDPVTVLSMALDAAQTDAERAALLAAAPRAVREQLNARLTYVKFIADSDAAIAAEHAAYAAFSVRLDLAEDDTARLAIIRSAAPAFVAKWRAHRTDTEDAARRRYLALATGVDGLS